MITKYNFPYALPLLIRFLLYFTGSAVGVLAVVISLEYQKFNLERSQSMKQESLRQGLALKVMQLELRESIEDVSTITSLQAIQDYANNETADNRRRLAQDFLSFSLNTREYDQIRYIDSSGKERVRVNFNELSPTIVPPDQLQDKSNRYYIREALSVAQNAIYISPLDLNIEHGQVQRPFKPMIRFAMPVFDTGDNLKGIVVLNYRAARMLNNFEEFMLGSWGEPMLVNSGGYWLSSPNEQDEWGFMLGSENNFGKRFSQAWDNIIRHDSGATESSNGLFIYKTMYPYDVNVLAEIAAPAERYPKTLYWKIVTRISPAMLAYSPLSIFQNRAATLIELLLLVGVLSAALAWLRTNILAKTKILRESERQLAEAQRIAHVGNWAWDISKGSLNWSAEIYRIFGRKPRPAASSYEAFLDAIHPDDREKVSAAIDEALEHIAPYAIDHRVVRPDGTVRYVHERGAVQCNHAGKPVQMLGTVHDVTESMEAARALRQSEARYRNLFENMIDGYVLYETLFDSQGEPSDYRCLEVNPAFERLTGLPRGQYVGKTLLETFPAIEPYWLELFGNVTVTGQSRHFERYAKPFDRYFDTTVSCPERGLVAVFFNDVTERKKSEQQLQKYRDELEEIVAKRTAALEASNKELETFSYSIAHDLRTPLRSITSFSQILEQEAGPKLSDEEREDLRRIVRAGRRMSELIDDILELARISRANFKIETVNLSELATTIVENLAKMHEKRSVRVDITQNLKCKGDVALLNVVLENLLSNAWKYTAPCANARIEFGNTRIDNNKVYYVRDNGVGFDMQYVKKLFKPFARLHSPDEFDGTGIGLVSVQSAIQRHNGKVWAESKEGDGATFYFTVPD